MGGGGGQGADAKSLAACGDCKLWLCGQTGDSNRQIRCFGAAAPSLSFAAYIQSPRGSYSLLAVCASVCVRVQGKGRVVQQWLGLQHIFVCLCMYTFFCAALKTFL